MTNPILELINCVDPSEPTSVEITLLVDNFYSKVRADPLLAPVFEGRVSSWPAHQQKMTGFWRSVLLGTKEYKGHLMAVHADLPGMAPAHFNRWLELFDQATCETLPLQAMPYTQYIAQRFARAMQLGLFPCTEQACEQAPTFNAPTSNHHGASAC